MLSTPPSTPHELCLSSASADRYEGHGTREYALAAEHARRRSPFQKGYEEGTPRHCVPCSDGQSLKLRPTLPSNTVPRASSFTSVQCPGVQQSGPYNVRLIPRRRSEQLYMQLPLRSGAERGRAESGLR
jgi:hypothetical protein